MYRTNSIEPLEDSEPRHEERNGVEYLVVPGILAKERVYEYDWGDEYLPEEELEGFLTEQKIVLDHPVTANGAFVSVNSPQAINRQIVGEFRNAELKDAKVKGEYWLRTDVSDPEYVEALETLQEGGEVATSPGYDPDIEYTTGRFNGEDYDAIQRNITPDHVGLIVTTGAVARCTPEEGCAVGRANANMCQCGDRFNALESAREPSYEGTESDSWEDVSKSLENFIDGYDGEVEASEWAELDSEVREWIASKTLLGDSEAEEMRDGMLFPVVNPATNNLNEGALEAVLGGRGAEADISEDQLESARLVARGLLDQEFDRDLTGNSSLKSVIERFNSTVKLLTSQVEDKTDDETMENEELIEKLTDKGFSAEFLENASEDDLKALEDNLISEEPEEPEEEVVEEEPEVSEKEEVEEEPEYLTRDEAEELVTEVTEADQHAELDQAITANADISEAALKNMSVDDKESLVDSLGIDDSPDEEEIHVNMQGYPGAVSREIGDVTVKPAGYDSYRGDE